VPVRHRDLRDANLALVLRELAAGRRTRAQLAARTGLTKATVSTLVERLAAAGLVAERTPETTGGSGRPGAPVELAADGPVGLGIEINVDYLAVCVTDLTGAVRAQRVVPADNRGRTPAAVLDHVVRAARAVLASDPPPLAGAGVALPGPVRAGTGVLAAAPNLGWGEVPVADLLAARLGVPVTADNEASYAALGELWSGVARGVPDFVHVSGEIGVGAGIVLGGALFRGVHGFAGEIGHVCVDPRGPRCGCGALGCLEAVAGQEALLAAAGLGAARSTRLGGPEGADRALVSRAAAGDPAVREALRTAGTALGRALAALVNVVDVGTVVLGGLYAPLAPWLVEPLTAELAGRVAFRGAAPPRVLVSELGPYAAVRGAAGAMVREIIERPGGWLDRPPRPDTTAEVPA
jgi:predicted NBD/HSP70 family sugar kinase